LAIKAESKLGTEITWYVPFKLQQQSVLIAMLLIFQFNCSCHCNLRLAFKMVYTITVHLYANDKPDSIDRIKAKLIEAARVYRKDKETIDWFVMQDVHDPRAFTIVERFDQESVRWSTLFPE
jgi:hypothetical protein